MYKIITIPCGNVNCYLIQGDHSAILIDTANTKYRNYLLEKLKDYTINLIILTHGHNDNIGNAAFIAKQFNAKIAMHRNDYKLSKNNYIHNIYSNSFAGTIFKQIFLRKFKNSKVEDFEPDIFLSDGDSLEKYGVKASIVHLPGHTKGSIGVLLNRNELIGGDVLMNIIYPSAALIAEDIDMLRKSIHKMDLLKLKLVYPGHGKQITSVKVNMQC